MSELDDFFSKRLNEESAFPNRGKQWKHLSKRLDAFDAGGLQGNPRKLRWWQAATVITLITCGLLLWKNSTTRAENKTLKKELADLQSTQTTLHPAEMANNTSKSDQSTTSTQIQHQETSITNHIRPEAQTSSTLPAEILNQTGKLATKPKRSEHREGQQLANPTESLSPNTANNPAPLEISLESILESNSEPIVVLPANFTENSALGPDSIQITSDSTRLISRGKETVVAQAPPIQDSITELAAAKEAAVIKPLHTPKGRFQIGTYSSLGFVQPKQKGVSYIHGQSISIEAKVIRNLWVSASLDWLRHEVSTEKFVSKFHPKHDSLPEPPHSGGGGWSHPSKLVLVESTSREQHLGLGLRYKFPIKFWAQPSLRVAHEWVRLSPSKVTYEFKEDDPGGPGPDPYDHDSEYVVEKFERQWISNQWRFGIGIEKEIPQWTFGLWADYAKDFSANTPGFDALYLRAGAAYRF